MEWEYKSLNNIYHNIKNQGSWFKDTGEVDDDEIIMKLVI